MPTVAQEYLDRLNALMEQLGSRNFNGVKLGCKHFFSGAAVYARGRICMSWTPVGFAIKLPEASRSILLKQHHATPLRYFPRGPIKKDYVVLPESILKDMKTFRRWVKVSVAYVVSLPAPERKAKSHITRRSTGRAKAVRR
jgi:hypothetical protein